MFLTKSFSVQFIEYAICSQIFLFLVQIGNGWIDDKYCNKGMYDYFWTHGLNSDETRKGIEKHCDFKTSNFTIECVKYTNRADTEMGNIDIYNIYAPLCNSTESSATNSVSCMLNFGCV